MTARLCFVNVIHFHLISRNRKYYYINAGGMLLNRLLARFWLRGEMKGDTVYPRVRPSITSLQISRIKAVKFTLSGLGDWFAGSLKFETNP